MKNFSISEIEKFSGIKAHTLRTWEQRYGLPKSNRNKTNLRYYSLDEAADILTMPSSTATVTKFLY